MARKCICQICRKPLTTDIAYKVSVKGRNLYYCSEEEYVNKQKNIRLKNECLETISKIINVPILTPAMLKEINKIAEYYEYIVIKKCFIENEKSIQWFLNNNENSTEYGKARYISTIILNNINKTLKKHKDEIKQMELLFAKNENDIDINLIDSIEIKKRDKEINDISDFLD